MRQQVGLVSFGVVEHLGQHIHVNTGPLQLLQEDAALFRVLPDRQQFAPIWHEAGNLAARVVQVLLQRHRLVHASDDEGGFIRNGDFQPRHLDLAVG